MIFLKKITLCCHRQQAKLMTNRT